MDGEAAEQLNGKQRRVPHEKSIAEAGDFRPSVGRFGKSSHIPCASAGRFGKSSHIPAPRPDDLANRPTFPSLFTFASSFSFILPAWRPAGFGAGEERAGNNGGRRMDNDDAP